MNFSPTATIFPIDSILPPLDLQRSIPNYLVERSFQSNWTEGALIHFPVRRPVGNSISAGDHYFEWRVPGRSQPIATVTFSICPFLDAEVPITYLNTSPRTGALNCSVFSYTVPTYLPIRIEEALLDLGDIGNGCDTASFVSYLNDFCIDYYRAVSPTSPPTNPLESK